MIFNKKTYLIGLSAVIVLVLAAVLYYSSAVFTDDALDVDNNADREIKNEQKIEPGAAGASSPEVYTNKAGQKWTLEDKADFKVATGNGAKIKFLEGKIDPLKVHPGDTQNMKIVVQGINGISSVTAEIETDNGTTTVELKKTGVLALKDSDLPKYVVDAKNELKVLSLPESVAYRAKEIEVESSSYNIARAAAGEREIYEGSWLVKDTSVRDYITIFTATDSQGNKEKLVLAWSDPCLDTTSAEWPLNPNGGNVDAKTVGCTISSVYGIDNGSLTLKSGANINVDGTGGILVLNPDKGLKFPTTGFGQLTFSSGGSYKPGYLWATDYDNDHYAAASTRQYTSTVSSPGSGYIRQSSLLSWTNDCDDFNTNVKPGQTAYFSIVIIDSGGTSAKAGTWDYNCSGAAELAPGQEKCSSIYTGQGYIYEDGVSFWQVLNCSVNEYCSSVGMPGDICINGYCCIGVVPFTACNNPVTPSTSDCGKNSKGASFQTFDDNGCTVKHPHFEISTIQCH